ncbi:MAG: bifunctional 23S rRNA (guanine(2069)-N(7))-methyltransferase RlmK/23S rRNA (guanine(2445)-N(2))-methyltransferase RlmL [Candidatus Latescibacterota bacterium]
MIHCFAPTPHGTADLLEAEIRQLGAAEVSAQPTGVAFAGTLEDAYRVCLWSRLASRLLLHLGDFRVHDAEGLYAAVRSMDWSEHLSADGTMAVDSSGRHGGIGHTHYAALKAKDAVVDQMRERWGRRPSVELSDPDVRIDLLLCGDRVTVSLDLAGRGLHRRGYRTSAGAAPLKENLAAAILLRAGWPAVAERGGALLDLMCGSGTLPIEAALMAADVAPGLLRPRFGFSGWLQHQPELWGRLCADAQQRRRAGLERLPVIAGFDADPRAVEGARRNVEAAGLSGHVEIACRTLADALPAEAACWSPGLVVANPPYGQRLGAQEALRPLYDQLGRRLRGDFAGWKAAVFTGNPPLGRALGLRPVLRNRLRNGPIECRLLRFEVQPRWFAAGEVVCPVAGAPVTGPAPRAPVPVADGAQMLANRLRRNLRTMGRWARREGIACYRLYDADMPEYALAIDLYQADRTWVHVQEYQAPRSVDPGRAAVRRAEALGVIPPVLGVPPEQVHYRVRRRQRGAAQYQKLAAEARFYEVREGPCVLLVNFTDYLDTGLFLDHRITRCMVGEQACGRHFLNLFGYTGAATVHAALGGARTTTTVDLSPTYLSWARNNLERNGLGNARHRLIRADCLEWLAEERAERYGLVFLDPPTFSNSKRMSRPFEVQRDHVRLIQQAAALLEPGGTLLFSTNRRRFRMASEALAGLQAEDITALTIPRDFARQPRVHTCWRLTRVGASPGGDRR